MPHETLAYFGALPPGLVPHFRLPRGKNPLGCHKCWDDMATIVIEGEKPHQLMNLDNDDDDDDETPNKRPKRNTPLTPSSTTPTNLSQPSPKATTKLKTANKRPKYSPESGPTAKKVPAITTKTI